MPTLPITAPGSPMVLATPDQLRQTAQRVSKLKGRQPDDVSLQEVRALIGMPPPDGHPRELLIEHLHLLSDHYLGLFERHETAHGRGV